MFGYDDQELERIRRGPPPLRLRVLLVLAVVGALLAAPAVVVDLLNDPARLLEVARRAFPAAPFAFSFTEVEWLPIGSAWSPRSWQFAVSDFTFRPHDAKKPDWSVDRFSFHAPEPMRSGGAWAIHTEALNVAGLAIHAHQQRPPEPWTPKDGVVQFILADVVHIRNASFEAPPDPPLGGASAVGIAGTLNELVFAPGLREVSASGHLRVRTFTTGNITVTDGDLRTFRLDRSTLHLGGTYTFAGAPGTVDGEIRTFHVRSEVELRATVQGAGLSEVIRTATGDDSAIDGRLDLDLMVYAGGDRPRGSSLLTGSVTVREGRIQLGRNTRYVVLDALTLLPWVDLNAYNQVEFQPMDGEIELTRGRVVLKGWTYPVGKRRIRVDGTLDDGDLYFFVRLLPREDLAEEDPSRRGVGMLMWGDRDQQQFKLATQEDLSAEQPWVRRVQTSEVPAADAKFKLKPLFPKRAAEREAAAAAADASKDAPKLENLPEEKGSKGLFKKRPSP